MSSKRTLSVQEIKEFTGVTENTIYRWIRKGKLSATKDNRFYNIPYEKNSQFLLAQLKKKHSKSLLAWTPKEIEGYSEWHEILDEISWLVKICYSSRDDVKRKHFRLDVLFINYMTLHEVSLEKVKKIFATNQIPNKQQITDDLKRGWYNELSYAVPLKKSTLGLSFSDIELNKEVSSIRFAFSSWRITSAYYSVYFYLRAVTFQKQRDFRLQEHSSTISVFKNNLLKPFTYVIWKFPFDISYTPKTRLYKKTLLITKLAHTKYQYSNHPRAPHRTPIQIFDHVHKTFQKKSKSRSKLASYTLFDYLHDFRIWANYLDIDNLLSLWGPGYKSFIDQNLSLILFFIGGISEICYLAIFGESEYLEQLQSLYNLFVTNNPELEGDFINTPIYQRYLVLKGLGLIEGNINLKKDSNLNVVTTETTL